MADLPFKGKLLFQMLRSEEEKKKTKKKRPSNLTSVEIHHCLALCRLNMPSLFNSVYITLYVLFQVLLIN